MEVTLRAVIDLDVVKYSASAAGEKRTVKVVHKTSGREAIYKTRTEFYGHWQKKDGGALAEINRKSKKDFHPDDFEYIDIQTPEPIENVLHTAKVMVERWLAEVNAEDHIGFIGQGDSWRVERSTILKYKGTRSLIKPLYLNDVSEYLAKKFNTEIVTHLEADDRCIMEAYRKKDHVVLMVEKDAKGCDILLYNPHKPELGIVDCGGYGSLWLNDRGKVDGRGRAFLYLQCASLDLSDNYRANCASDIPWGEKSAYKALSECKNDKEALEALVSIYKHLYPEPKTVTGWRGDEINIDWKYVLHENWDLARMLRWEGDVVNPFEVMDKLGVKYDN